jgi:chorismate synthase
VPIVEAMAALVLVSLMAQNARESTRSLLPALKVTLPNKGIVNQTKRDDEAKRKANGHAINGSTS